MKPFRSFFSRALTMLVLTITASLFNVEVANAQAKPWLTPNKTLTNPQFACILPGSPAKILEWEADIRVGCSGTTVAYQWYAIVGGTTYTLADTASRITGTSNTTLTLYLPYLQTNTVHKIFARALSQGGTCAGETLYSDTIDLYAVADRPTLNFSTITNPICEEELVFMQTAVTGPAWPKGQIRYNWYVLNDGGASPATSPSGNVKTQNFSFDTTSFYTYTPDLNNDQDSIYVIAENVCGLDTAGVKLTVNPKPEVAIPSGFNIVSTCDDDSIRIRYNITNAQLDPSSGSTNVNWTVYLSGQDANDAALIALFPASAISGTGNTNIDFKIAVWDLPFPSAGIYTITIDSIRNTTNGCTRRVTTNNVFNITAYPQPTAQFSTDSIGVCAGIGGSFFLEVDSATYDGNNVAWSISVTEQSGNINSSCNIAGSANATIVPSVVSGTGNRMGASRIEYQVPSNLNPGIYRYIITAISSSTNAGSCTPQGVVGATDTIEIHVFPRKTVSFTPTSQIICQDATGSFTANFSTTTSQFCGSLGGGLSNATFDFYFTDNTVSSVTSPTALTSASASLAITTNVGTTLAPGVYTFTADSIRNTTANHGGCTFYPSTVSHTLTVQPKPSAAWSTDTVTVCQGSTATFSVNVTNATFGPNNANWQLTMRERGGHTGTTGAGANCTDGANPTTMNAIVNLNPSGSGNSSITYTVPANSLPGLYYYVIDSVRNTSPQNCGGQNVQDTIWIRVNPVPLVSLNPVSARVCELDSSPMTIVVSNRQECTVLGSPASDVNWQYWFTDNTNSSQLTALTSPVGPPNSNITAYTSPSLLTGTYWVYIDSLKNTTHGCATSTRPDSALFIVDPRPEVEFDQDTVDVCEGTTGTFSITVSNTYLAQYDSNWTVSYTETSALQSASCAVSTGANQNLMGGTLNTLTGFREVSGVNNQTVTFNIPSTLAPGIYSYVLRDVTNDDGPCTGFVLSDDTIYIRVVPAIRVAVNGVTPVLDNTVGTSSLYVSADGDTVCQGSTLNVNYSVTGAQFCQSPGTLADQSYKLSFVDQGDITDVTTQFTTTSSTTASPYGFNDRVGKTSVQTGNQNFTLNFDATGIQPFENFTFILSADSAAYPSANCSSTGSGADMYSTTFVFATRPEPRVSFSDSFLTVCEGTNSTTFTISVDSANYSDFGTAVERTFSFNYVENSGNIASAPACQPNTVTQNILGFPGNQATATGDTSWTITVNATSITPGIYRYVLTSITNSSDGCAGFVLASHDTITIEVRPQIHYSILGDSTSVCEGETFEFDINVFNAAMCDSLSGIGATGSEEWRLYYNTNADADITSLNPNYYQDNGNTTFSVTLNNNGLLTPGIYKFYTDSIVNFSSPVLCVDRSRDSFVLAILPEPTVVFDQTFIEICEGDADSVSFTVANAVFGASNVNWTVYYHLSDSASAANSCNNAASLAQLTINGSGNGTTQIQVPAAIYNTPGIYTYTLDSIRNNDPTYGSCGAGAASLPGNTTVTIYVYPKPQIVFTPSTDEICENEVVNFSVAINNTAYCPSVGSTANVGWNINGVDNTNSNFSTGGVVNTSFLSNPYTANVGTLLAAAAHGTYFIRIDSIVNTTFGCVDSSIAQRYDLKIDSLPVVSLTSFQAEVCEDSSFTMTFNVSRVRTGDSWEFDYQITGANAYGPITVTGTGNGPVTVVVSGVNLNNDGTNNVNFTPIDNTTTRPGAGCEADTAMSSISFETLEHPDVTAFAPTASQNICSGLPNNYNITVTNTAGKNWRIGYTITSTGPNSTFVHNDTFTGFGAGTFTRAIDTMYYASTNTNGAHENRTITLNFIEWTGVTPGCPNTNLTDNSAPLTIRPLPYVVLNVPDSACATSTATITYEVFNVLNGETINFFWNTTNPADGPNLISQVAGPGATSSAGPTATGSFTTDPLFPTGYSDVWLTNVNNTTTGCSEVSPWQDSIRVDPASFVGQITPSYTLCSNNPDVDTIRVVNNVGRVVKYQSKPLAWGVWSDLDLNSEAITSIVLGDTSYFTFQYKLLDHTYRAIVKSGACPEDTTDFSDYVSVKVYDQPTFNMLSYDSTLCVGDSAQLNFAVVVEESSSNWRIKYNVNGTPAFWTGSATQISTTRFLSGLTAGTYTLTIDSIFNLTTGCDTAVGQSFTIRVAGPATAGSLSYDPYVCSGNAATVFWVPGTGAVKYWQTSTNGGATWANSSSIANSITISTITDTTWVRAIVENAPCADTVHSPIGMIVPLNGIGGGTAEFTSASPGGKYCATSTGTRTLNVTVKNMGSSDSWTVYWLDKNVLDSASGTGNGNFDVVTKSGHMTEDFDVTLTTIRISNTTASCSKALQNNAIAQIDIIDQPNATIGTVPTELCQGSTVTFTVNISNVNSSDAWSLGYKVGSTAQTATGTGPGTFTITSTATVTAPSSPSGNVAVTLDSIKNTTQLTSASTNCNYTLSDAKNILVYAPTLGGNAASAQTVCLGANSGSVSVTGHIGNVLYWEYNDGGNWIQINSSASDSTSFSNLTKTTQYRAIVKNGVCGTVASSPVTITIQPLPTVTITNNKPWTVCSGDNAVINFTVGNLVNPSNATWTLNYTVEGVSASVNGTGATGSLTVSNVTVTDTDVELVSIQVTGGSTPQCANNALTDKIVIKVTPNPTATITAFTTEMCSGDVPSATVSVNNVGTTDNWTVYYTFQGVSNSWSGTGPGNFTRNTANAGTYTTSSTPWSLYRVITLDSIINNSSGTSSGHGPCKKLNLDTDSVQVHAPSIAGTATGNATVCDGANTGTINLSGNVGNVQYWEFSTNGGASWTSINSSASNTINYNNLTVTTRYRAVVKNGTCATATSNEVTITIQPLPTVTITNSKPWTVCSGDNAVINFTVGNLVNPSNATWTLNYTVEGVSASVNGTGATGSLTVSNVTVTDTDVELVSIQVTGGSTPQCTNPALTDKIVIKVKENPTATITAFTTEMCSGDVPSATVSVNNVGTTDNWTVYYTFQGVSNIWSGTGPGNFTRNTANAGTYTTTSTPWSLYRVITLDSIINNSSGTSSGHGPCKKLNLDRDSVQVHAPSIAGTATGNATVCDGANTGTINLSGNVGNVQYWEFSTNGGASWTSINSSASNTINYNNLTVTTRYRAVVKNGTCATATSNEVTITIQPLPTVTITNSKPWTVCSGDNAVINFTVGNLVNPSNATWTLNYTVEGVSASVNGTGATGSLTVSNVTVTDTDVELVSIQVTGGSTPQCTNPALTDKIVIKVKENPTATITAFTTEMCSGDVPSATVSVNNVGTTDNWTVYYTFQGVSNNWSGTGPGNFTRNTANAGTYTTTSTPWSLYRVITLDSIINNSSGTSSGHGPCKKLNLDRDSVQVHAPSIAGTATGNATVCDGANSGSISLSGNVGNVQYWEFSTNGGASWTSINSSASNTINYNNLTVTTRYRAVVKNGTCATATSNEVTITIQPLPTVTITNSKPWTVCSGDAAVINYTVGNLVNPSNATWTLNYTVEGVSASVNGNGASGSLTVPNVIVTDTDVELVSISVTGGDQPRCTNPALTDKIVIKVIDNPKATLTSARQAVCNGDRVNFTISVNNVGSADNWTVTYTFQSNTENVSGTGPGNFSFVTTNPAVNTGATPINMTMTLTQIVNNTSGSRTSSGHGPCDSTLNSSQVVQVDPTTVGGTARIAAGSSSPVCFATNTGTVEVINNVGDVIGWQRSTDGGNTWTDLAGPADTQYTFNNLQVTTWFRAVVRSGQCKTEFSVPVRIDIQQLPVARISNNKPWTVCYGDNATINFNVTNLVAPTSSATWTLFYTVEGVNASVSGTGTTGSLTVNNVTVDDTDVEFNRIVVTGGNNPQCANDTLSDKIVIKVKVNPTAKITSIPTELCNGERAEVTFSVNNVGTVDNWTLHYTIQGQSNVWSGTGPGTFTRTTVGAVSYTTTGLPWSVNRAISLDSIINNSSGTSSGHGPCKSLNLDRDSIEVHAPSIAGTATGNATVCVGANSGSISLANNVGDVLYWEFSTNNGTSWTALNSTASNTISYNNLTVTTQYRAIVKNGTCATATSNTVTITMQPLPVARISNSKPWTVCYGDNAIINFNISNLVAPVGGADWTLFYTVEGVSASVSGSGATGSLTVNNVTVDDTDVEFTRIVVTGGNNPQCANDTLSDKIVIKVKTNPDATLTTIPTELCNGERAEVTFSVNNVGTVDNWTVHYTLQGNRNTWSGTGPGTFTRTTASAVSYTTTSAPWSINVAISLDSIINNSSGTSSGHGPCKSANLDRDSIKVSAPSIGGVAALGSGTTSPVCQGQNSGSVVVSGNVGEVVRWQFSTDSTNWTNMPTTASTSANFNNLSVRTWFRAEVKNGVCGNAFSAPVRIDIQPLPTLTVATTNVEVCAGVAFNLTFRVHNVPSGHTFEVTYDINGTKQTFTGVSTSFTSSTHTLASSGLQRTADYTFTGIRITNGTPACQNTINENTKVTVNDLPNATLVSFSDNICETDQASFTVEVSNVKVGEGWTINYNINGGTTSPTPFTGSGPGVFNFKRSLPSPTGSANSVTNQVNFELVTNNKTGCTNIFDSSARIKVDKITNPGTTVAGSSTVCSGTNSGTIGLSNNNGQVLRWESSEDNGATWSIISSTNSNYSYNNLTKTTRYRVLVQNGACDAKYSDTATVTVNELPVATIAGSTAICEGSTAILNVTVGNTYGAAWEITYLDSNVKRNWTGTGNGTFNFTVGPLTNTTDFTLQSIRLTSGSPQCVNNNLVNNATATVTVIPLPNATIVSKPDSLCENTSASFTVNVTGVKTTENWRLQYRINGVVQTAVTGTGSGTFVVNTPALSAPNAGIRLFTIANTSSTPQCTQTLTDSVNIRIDLNSIGGTLASAVDTVCKGNETTLTVSGFRGRIVKWQFSVDGTNWSDIANTNATYTTGALNRTTWYRVVVKNGACNEAVSTVKQIFVNELPTLTVTPNTTSICSGSTVNLTFSVANSYGKSWRVDYRANGTTQSTPVVSGNGSASSTITFGPLTTTTDYDFVRVTITSGASNTQCTNTINERATVIVIDNPNATIVSVSDSVCTGSAATVNLNVSNVKAGENWRVDYTINGVAQAAFTGTGPGNFTRTTPALTTIGNNTILLTGVTNTSSTPNCSRTLNESRVVRVDDNTLAGTLSSSTSRVCFNANSGTLTLGGTIRGRIIRWEYSEDNGASWTVTSNNANTLNFLNLKATTVYRVLVQNGACAPVYSNNITVVVIPEPMAVVSGSPEVCTGTTAQFLVTISNVAVGESWTLNFTENGVARTLSGTGPGTFTLTTNVLNYTSTPSLINITLTSITNVTQGCTNAALTSAASGRITPRPVVSFTTNNECEDSVANFASTSRIAEGSIVAYRWSFGDGQTSGNANANNTYANAGVYTVKLVATSNNGCQDSTTSNITIFSNPVADFTFSNSCQNADAVFTNASSVTAAPGGSSINSNRWSFGDGRTSTAASPAIRYATEGTYDVTLTVGTNNGCFSTVTKQITIYPVPVANFVANEVCENSAMSFTNATTVSSGNTTYEWDFAGQGTSTAVDPRFTFTGFGNFNVRMIATSNFGCKDTFNRTVVVNPLPTADFTVADVCIGGPSNFVNTSTVPTGSIREYYWNLGDTTFNGLTNPTHTYRRAGTYNATLRVVTDKGCEHTVTKPVVVNPLPVVVITPNGRLDFCDGDSVSLTVSNGIATGLRSQLWSTGESTVTVTAKTGGYYRVRITDLNGCENEDSIEVIVYPNPVADAGRDTVIDKGASVTLNGAGGLTYSWSPTTYLNNPNIPTPMAEKMLATTTYTLTVTDQNGCIDTDDVTVTVVDRFNLIIYNLVTPNGDGANDTWWIENIWAYPDAEVVIVNRYGMEVFRTKNYQNDWDGTYNGNELPDGAYYYIITVPGSDKVYKGAINLVRTNK